MRAPRRARARHAGFTLVELIVVIVVTGVLGAIVTPVALASLRANGAILDVATTVDKARLASDRLAFEMRELSSGSIVTPGASGLVFSRTDYTGAATARVVTIDQIAAGTVVSGGVTRSMCNGVVRLSYSVPVISPAYTPVLTDQVCSLTFAYYDQAGVSTTAPADMRYIDFTLTLQPAAGGALYAQRTRVALRNR